MNIAQLLGKDTHHLEELSSGHLMHREVISSWLNMQNAAKAAGFNLTLASSFRSFERQQIIFNEKLQGKRKVTDLSGMPINLANLSDEEKLHAVMLFSALPGASRHHWGTDIDVYDPSLLSEGKSLQLEPWEYQENGPFEKLAVWLKEHAEDHGFYSPYDKFRGGVAHEPWHLSYYPIANECMAQLTPQSYVTALSENDLTYQELITNNIDMLWQQYVVNVGECPRG